MSKIELLPNRNDRNIENLKSQLTIDEIDLNRSAAAVVTQIWNFPIERYLPISLCVRYFQSFHCFWQTWAHSAQSQTSWSSNEICYFGLPIFILFVQFRRMREWVSKSKWYYRRAIHIAIMRVKYGCLYGFFAVCYHYWRDQWVDSFSWCAIYIR